MANKFSSFHQLFSSIETQQTPALVWYSVPGERIELSGRVLMNWVAKTSNFLDDELDFSDDPEATVAFGPHWRSAAIACAVLNAGGKVSFETDSVSPIFVTDSVDEAVTHLKSDEHEYVVAVDRGALSPRFMGSLPADAVDYCAEVRSFGDVYFPLNPTSGAEPAWDGATHSQALKLVLEDTAQFANAEDSAFVLPVQNAWSSAALITVLAIISSGKTAVLLDPTIPWEDARLNRILQDEKAIVL